MFLQKWLVPDNLPQKADAICCLSYGLSWDKTRLAEQGFRCVFHSVRLYKDGKAPLVIFSNSYEEYWLRESQIKDRIAHDIPTEAISHLRAVNHTYDEASQIKTILEKESAKSLILVADRWHMKRALDAFQRLMPEVTIYPSSVNNTRYEMAREPSLIKSIRSRFEILWILWNILFFYLNPIFIKNRS